MAIYFGTDKRHELFRIDRTYSRRHIVHHASEIKESPNKRGLLAILKAPDSSKVDVAYSFERRGESNKFTCYGFGRADSAPSFPKGW